MDPKVGTVLVICLVGIALMLAGAATTNILVGGAGLVIFIISGAVGYFTLEEIPGE